MLLLLLTSLALASAQRLTDAEELAFKDNVEDLCRGRFVCKFIICQTICKFVMGKKRLTQKRKSLTKTFS